MKRRNNNEASEKGSKDIDLYIQKFPEPIQNRLKVLRKIIRELAPEATEKISYHMPAFFLERNLVYYAAHTNHIGMYPGAKAVETHKQELSDFNYAKGSIQFPNDKPLPSDLIRKIIRYKLVEISKDKVFRKKSGRKGKLDEMVEDDDCYP